VKVSDLWGRPNPEQETIAVRHANIVRPDREKVIRKTTSFQIEVVHVLLVRHTAYGI
jgi:hypothetical protein